MKRYELTDAQWELVADVFPKAKRRGRRPKAARLMLNAIFWLLNTGAPWRDLPEERFGPWETVYTRFKQWRDAGVIDAVLRRLQLKLDAAGRLDFELWCVDGSVSRATRAAAGAQDSRKEEPKDHALGRSRGGFTTKFHLVTDGKGVPLDVQLTPGQTHDSMAFERVMNSALELLAVETATPARKAQAASRRRRQGL